MRAYTIETADLTDNGFTRKVIGLTSSKKQAITACEKFVQSSPTPEMKWEEKGKHFGHVDQGDLMAEYRMFFINKEPA